MCVCDRATREIASKNEMFLKSVEAEATAMREAEARKAALVVQGVEERKAGAAVRRVRISPYVPHIAELLERQCAQHDCTRSPRLPSIIDYLTRLSQHSGCGDEVFISMVVLVSNVIESRQMECNHQTVHHLILSCFVLAAKVCDDRALFLSNKAFARIGGIPVEDLNEWEKFVLEALDWNVFVDERQYNMWVEFFAHVISPRC